MSHSSNPINAVLVGGPTLCFSYAGLSFLTDPTFDPPGSYTRRVTLHKLTGPALQAEDLGVVDVVLLSHDEHADNLDDSGRALLENIPMVLSTPGAASRIPGVKGMGPWETHSVGPVEITAVPALHGPVGCEAITGEVTGFVLRAPEHPVVYVSGDNASVDLVGLIAERTGRIDVAILFAGAANVGAFGDTDITFNAHSALAVAKLLGDARIVAVHAEGWAHFSETRERLALIFGLAGEGERLIVPEPGRPFTVDTLPVTQ